MAAEIIQGRKLFKGYEEIFPFFPRVSTYRGSVHLSLVRKIVSKLIRQRLKILELINFQTTKVALLLKDKPCWSEIIFNFWSSNVFEIQV